MAIKLPFMQLLVPAECTFNRGFLKRVLEKECTKSYVGFCRRRRPCRQQRRKKNHVIEAAPFGRLDQMLQTTFPGGSGRALPPQPKTGESGGQRPPAKNFRKKTKILGALVYFQVLSF